MSAINQGHGITSPSQTQRGGGTHGTTTGDHYRVGLCRVHIQATTLDMSVLPARAAILASMSSASLIKAAVST